jgi:hypothetical protein
MIPKGNKGFNQEVLEEYRQRMAAAGQPFIWVDEEENTEEHVHIYFIGKYEGHDVVYDAVIYTLRLQHESELFEIAEHRAAKHFPDYRKITYQEDENGNLRTLDSLEEEIGLFMAEVIMEMEEEGQVKVREHADIDPHLDFGIGLDVGLHVDAITPRVIAKFINDFNAGTLQLDPASYSFQTQSQEADS